MFDAFLPDALCVRHTLAGRPDRFETLVRRHLTAVRAIALARTGNPADADDVVQETFLRAYQKLDDLRDPRRFRAWVVAIARRVAGDVAVKRAREAGDALRDGESVPPHDHARDELHAMLWRELRRLDPGKREVLLLHYFAGDSAREIARELNVSRAAVLKRLQRARTELGEAMVKTIAGEVAQDRPVRDQVKEIAKLAVASGAAWQLSKAAAKAGALSWAAVLPKGTTLVTAALGGVLTLAGVWMLVVASEHQPATAERTRVAAGDSGAQAPADPANSGSAADPSRPFTGGVSQLAVETTTDDEPRRGGQAPESTGDPVEDVRLQVPVNQIVFEDVHLAEILSYVSERTGVKFLLDLRAVGGPTPELLVDTVHPAVVPDERIPGMLSEVNIRDTPLLEALDLMAQEIGLRVVWEPGVLWISSPSAIRREVPRYSPDRYDHYDNGAKLEQAISLDFRRVHLSELTAFTCDTYNVNIALDYRVVRPRRSPDVRPALPPGKATEGVVPFLRLEQIRLRDAMRTLLRIVNLDYAPRREFIWVASLEEVAGERAQSPQAVDTRWDKSLSQPVAMVFEDVSVYDILDYLEDTYGIDVVVDQRVIAWDAEPAGAVSLVHGGRGGPAGQPVTHGIVHWVHLNNCSVPGMLDALLPQLDLAYSINPDGVVIVTRPTLIGAGQPSPEWLKRPEEVKAIVKDYVTRWEESVEKQRVRELERDQERSNKGDLNEAEKKPVLLRIREVPGSGYRVQIRTAHRTGWYSQGDAFEHYRLAEIDPATNSVVLLDEQHDETLTLRAGQ